MLRAKEALLEGFTNGIVEVGREVSDRQERVCGIQFHIEAAKLINFNRSGCVDRPEYMVLAR